MKIFLAPIAPPPPVEAIPEFEALAHQSTAGRHQLVPTAADADVCLFVDLQALGDPVTLRRVQGSPTYREFRKKCFVYDQRPRAYCSLPGIFTSVPSWTLRFEYQVPWGYHSIEDPRDFLDGSEAEQIEPDLLFSFVGTGKSHRCRPPLLELSHPRAVVTSVDGHVNWEPDQPGYTARRADFARTMLRSKFVLCPSGRATSSIRFYETMACGRVPVVIADDWVPPKGLDLGSVAIHWPEKSPHKLVKYLESREDEAAAMGREAARIYRENFAPEVTFDRIGDLLEDLAATDPWAHFPKYGFPPDRRVIRHVLGRARKLLKGVS